MSVGSSRITHRSSHSESDCITVLERISRRVRWTATAIVDTANRGRPNTSGVKVGGHQASSASMVEIMTSLWFSELTSFDQVSVKPHASPVLHAINYLLGDLAEEKLGTLREKGGLQSYPSRSKDPDAVDFSTGSVGIGATATIWAAMAHRFVRDRYSESRHSGRFIALLGDAELDEGAIWEAVADPTVAKLGELFWIVDLNRQSLDRVVPDSQIQRLRGMFEAAGWQVLTRKWGKHIEELFCRPGGDDLRARLEMMPNEEYQRILRSEASEIYARLCSTGSTPAMEALLRELSPDEQAAAIRDLGGHDIELLLETYEQVDPTRPTVLFAYTIKGRGLATEGHPNNHSALLTEAQMQQLADECSMDISDPWQRFLPSTAEFDSCTASADRLRRAEASALPDVTIPTALPWSYGESISSQATLGRFLTDLRRAVPDLAHRVVTCSPDVATTTNLGGWINKTGIWSVGERYDWFADDSEQMLRWVESPAGQHIELGIAETNLVGLAAELGTTWSRWGRPLIPIAIMYDSFVARALEPWSFGIYAGGQSILIGTPSGVTLAPEGGAHQSVTTPSIGLEQPECTAWEPAFAQDLEWCMLKVMSDIGSPEGRSAYFRLSTRPVDQSLASLPSDEFLLTRRREHAVSGGYRITDHDPTEEKITLVGVGAIMPEVIETAHRLEQMGVKAGVVCLTSPDLVFEALQQRNSRSGSEQNIVDILFPPHAPRPLVTVQDGHPHTLSFLAGARGDRTTCLGVKDFGQSSSLEDAYRIHGIDTDSLLNAALNLIR